jgi:hypothetical protein
MPCTVIFDGGEKRTSLTLEPDAEEVGERLAQAPTGFLCFVQRGGKEVSGSTRRASSTSSLAARTTPASADLPTPEVQPVLQS